MKQIQINKTVITYTRIKALLFAGVLILAYAITNTTPTPRVEAAVPMFVNFQGKLTNVSNGTNVADGNYTFEFKLYDAPTGGSLLWTETWDGSPSPDCDELAVTNGVFNAKLGACNSLSSVDFSGGDIYLTVNFDDGGGFDGEMVPRKQLVSSAFAFVANSVVGDGVVNTENQSTAALSIGQTLANPALQVDTNTASSATGLKVTSAAATGGVALAAISSGTNESLTLDAKGSGSVSINAAATGDILLGGGSSSTGCTLTNSTGALACASNISSGGVIQAGGTTAVAYSRLGTGTTNQSLDAADDLLISDDLEVNGDAFLDGNATVGGTLTLTTDLSVANGGTGASSFTANGVLYGNGTSAIAATAAGTTGQCLVATTASAPSWGSCGISGVAWNDITAPTGNLSLAHAGNTTAFSFNSVTTANAFALSSSSLSSGSLLDLSVTGTAAASNTQRALNVSTSGANSTTQTTYAGYFSNTHTGPTPTNIALYASASGGSNNYAAIFENGNVGIGTTSPAMPLSVGYTGTAGTTVSVARFAPNSNPTGTGAGSAIELGWNNNSTSVARVGGYYDGSGTALGFYTANGFVTPTQTAVILGNGNFGVGDTSPSALLTVGNGDLFQVNSSGAIAAAVGITSAGGTVNLNNNSNFATNINTGTSNALVTIGGGSGTFSLQTTNIDISNTGVISGATGITSSGTITFSGLTPDRLVTTTTGGQLTNTISSANLALSISDETGSGLAVFGTNPTFSASATFSGLAINSAVYTNGSSALTTTAPTSGTIGYWSRSGTTLQPATANDVISISGNSGDITTIASSATGSANKALNVSQTGATTGTDYAGYFTNTGAATTNIGLYASATGGTNNYAAIFENGNVGIGTTAPAYALQLGEPTTGETVAVGYGGRVQFYDDAGAIDSDYSLQAYTSAIGSSNFILAGGSNCSGGAGSQLCPFALRTNGSFPSLLVNYPFDNIGGYNNIAVANFGRYVDGANADVLNIMNTSPTTSSAASVNFLGVRSSDTEILSQITGIRTSSSSQSGAISFSTANSGSPAERMRLTAAGALGLGTTAPDRALEINSATGNNLRLTYNDADGSATNYADLLMSSGGDLTIDPSGGDTIIDGNLRVTGLGGGGTQCVNVDNDGDLGVTTCGSSLTPWTSDIDADGYDLRDLSNLEFQGTTGAPAGSVVAIFSDNTGDININALTGKTVNLQVNGADEYNFSSTALAMNSNNITGVGTALTAAAGLTVTATAADLNLATATSGNITLAPASTGSVQITSGVTTGTGTSSGFSLQANSLTTGVGANFASSSLSSGSLVNIAVTGTAAASSTQTALNVSTSGANATGSESTYAARFSNTHTGTSAINYGLFVEASGAPTNVAATFNAGRVGVGLISPGAQFHVQGDELDGFGNGLISFMVEGSPGQSGFAPGGTGGDIYLYSGAGGSDLSGFGGTGGNAGHVYIYGADGGLASLGTPGSGGNVVIQGGEDGNTSGVFGSVLLAQDGGNVGIGTTGPDRALEINSAAGNNLRLTYNDSNGSATNYADLLMSSGGDLTITPSGGDTTITGNLTVSGLGGSGTRCVEVNNSGVLAVAGAACGTGSLTPWVSDIDADGYDLRDLSNLEFQGTTGAPAGSVVAIFSDNTGDLNANVLTAKTFNVQVNGTDEYNFSSTALAMNGNNITGLGTALTAAAGLTIGATAADLNLVTTTSGNINITPAAGEAVFITASNVEINTTGSLDMNVGAGYGQIIGNDVLFFVDGAGQIDVVSDRFWIDSAVTTGTATSSGLYLSANTLTTGHGASFVSSSLSSGSLVNIAVTGTAAASNTQTALNVTTSGANATSTQTTYGGYFSNTHTGTASTNIGLYSTASGGTNNFAGVLVGNVVTNGTQFFNDVAIGDVIINAHDGASFTTGSTIFKVYRDGFGAGTRISAYASLMFQDHNDVQRVYIDLDNGEVGINTSSADRQLEINSAAGNNLRLTYNDSNGSATNYADLLMSSGGDLSITPSGGDTTITGTLAVSGLSINSAVYTNGSSVLTTTAPTSGNLGYWNRTGTLLSPATSGDTLSVPGAGSNSEKFGAGSAAAGNNSVAIGNTASASGANSVAVGGSSTGLASGVAIGLSATNTGINSIAIGESSSSAQSSIVIGRGATTSTTNTLVIGGANDAISNIYFGKGETSATATAYTINGTGGSGTDIAGAAINIAGGRGTGTGNGGNLLFQVAYPSTTGSSLNSLTTVATFNADNNDSSGTQNLISFTPTVNQSGTAGYTGLLLNVTQTATGSGTRKLLDVQAGGTTYFSVLPTDPGVTNNPNWSTAGNLGVGSTSSYTNIYHGSGSAFYVRAAGGGQGNFAVDNTIFSNGGTGAIWRGDSIQIAFQNAAGTSPTGIINPAMTADTNQAAWTFGLTSASSTSGQEILRVFNGNLSYSATAGIFAVDKDGNTRMSGALQVGGTGILAYSRLGTGTTSNSLDASNDLLISDDLEVNGDAFFDGNITILGTCTGCGGGSQTPWTSDIDADGYDLNDLSNLEFRSTTGAPAGSVVAIFSDNTGDININALTGKTVNLQVNGTDEYNFSSTALAMNGNNITGLGTALTAAAGLTVTATAADLNLVTATSGDINITPVSGGVARVDALVVALGDVNAAGNETQIGIDDGSLQITATANSIYYTSGATTGTGTSSAFYLEANQLTSGVGLGISANGLSSGSALDINVNSTAAASNTQRAINVSLSGANATSSQTTYGGYFSNTHTGTSSTNVAGYFTASGGTSNYAAIFDSGYVGIGDVTPESVLDINGPSSGDHAEVVGVKSTTSFGINVGAAIALGGEYGVGNTLWAGIKGAKENATSGNYAGYLSFYTRANSAGLDFGGSNTGEVARLTSAGSFGLGTTAPDRALEINSATGNNLRLTYNDADGSATNYADLLMSAGGDLTIAPSGGDTNITGNLIVSSLTSGGTQCLQANSSGVISGTGSACGSGGGFSGEVDDTTNDALTFTSDDGTPPAGTVNSIFRDNTGDLNLNVVTGKTFNVQVNGTDEYNFSSTALAMNGNNITGLGTALTAAAGLTMSSTSAALTLSTTTSGNIDIIPAASGSVRIGDPLGANNATNINVNDSTETISFRADTAINMRSTGTIIIGDVFGDGNLTYLNINDTAGTLTTRGTSLTHYAQNTTGTGVSSGFSLQANSLTTGTGADFASSSLSSGSLVNIAVTGTAAASNTQRALNVTTSGANGTSTQTTYGGYFSNTKTGTASTNVAGYFSASGGTNNYAAIFENGNVGVGLTNPTSLLHVQQFADSANTSTPVAFDINSVGAAGELTASSGIQTFARIAPVINQSGSAGFTSLLISQTTTATGSGSDSSILIEDDGSPVFRMDAGGVITRLGTQQTNIGGNGALWYRSGLPITMGNSGDSGASSLVLQAGVTGSNSASNISLVVSDTEVARFTSTARLGVNTTAPDLGIEINSATGNNLRLTYNDSDGSATNYADLLMSSGGDLTIDPSGGDTIIDGNLRVTGLGGGGTQCVNVDNDGDLGVTTCGGGGAWSDLTAPSGNLTLAHGANTTTMTFNSVTTGTAWTQSSTSITSGNLYSFGHSTSTFTGNGLFANFANGSGSFTGNFADFQVNGTSRFKIGSGTVTGSGASAVAGVLQDLVMNNSTGSGFQFGNRLLNTVSSSVAGTHVGQFIRVTDSTSLSSGQVVRGLEVQAYSGTNNNGINTGIATFGKTFGIHAESSGQAGAVSQPAAVFAYLNQVAGQEDVGNAIRAYSDTIEDSVMVSVYQEDSAFVGDGLVLNFGNGTGSFSGNFADFQVAGSSKFSVSSAGIVNLNLNATATTNGLCHSGADVDTATDTQRDVVSCSAAPGDIAEWYETKPGVEAGDIVSVTNENFVYTEKDFNAFTGEETGTTSIHTISVLKKSNAPYDNTMVGIVSTSPYQTFGKAVRDGGAQNPQPVALKGRVLVKVTNENGVIMPGDYITTSGTQAGKGMKAINPGMVIGQAISSDDGTGKVMVFVQPFFFDPGLQIDNNGNVVLQRGTATTSILANTQADAAYVIKQEGSGDILQLQSDGIDRLLVANNGSLSLNTTPVDDADLILNVMAAETSKFSINARGDLAVSGVIVIREDSFAGSIITEEDGLAEITFAYHLGTGKPVIQLTAEAQLPVFPQVVEFKTDDDGNYTGFVIKTFDLISAPVQATVHYTVFAKQDGYETFGTFSEPEDNFEFLVIDGGEVIGDSGGGSGDNGFIGDGDSGDGGEVMGDDDSGSEQGESGGEDVVGDSGSGDEGTGSTEGGSGAEGGV